jgi:hypothetical protein
MCVWWLGQCFSQTHVDAVGFAGFRFRLMMLVCQRGDVATPAGSSSGGTPNQSALLEVTTTDFVVQVDVDGVLETAEGLTASPAVQNRCAIAKLSDIKDAHAVFTSGSDDGATAGAGGQVVTTANGAVRVRCVITLLQVKLCLEQCTLLLAILAAFEAANRLTVTWAEWALAESIPTVNAKRNEEFAPVRLPPPILHGTTQLLLMRYCQLHAV